MDIVVTIPKTEYENDDKEIKELMIYGDLNLVWILHSRPKKLQIDDRVYFVKYNRITRSMRVLRIEKDTKIICETTGRSWNGKYNLILDDLRMESIDGYIKGFQGFRYFNTVMEGKS